MDGHHFDNLTRRLAAPRSRRELVRTLGSAAAGGLLALVGAGRARATRERVALCHFTGDPVNPYVIIAVAGQALADHQAHGDVRFTDCCLDADCDDSDPCTDDTCDAGACRHDPIPNGAPCGDTCCGPSTTCVNGTCQPCTPIGFEPENACTASTLCCDGGTCVTFPTFTGSPSFCRPADCRLGGESCSPDPTVCCSFTCTGDVCQQ